jgi:hypothetical protein
MINKKFPALSVVPLALFQLALSGCITQSLYVGRGQVVDWQGKDQEAALYWHNSEGRLWYGKKWEGHKQNFVTLRLGCETALQYAERPGQGLVREASSTGTDYLISKETAAGSVEPLAARMPASADHDVCGYVVGKKLVSDLKAGETVQVSVLCEKCGSTDSGCTAAGHYPRSGNYALGPITVQKKRHLLVPSPPEAPKVRCTP